MNLVFIKKCVFVLLFLIFFKVQAVDITDFDSYSHFFDKDNLIQTLEELKSSNFSLLPIQLPQHILSLPKITPENWPQRWFPLLSLDKDIPPFLNSDLRSEMNELGLFFETIINETLSDQLVSLTLYHSYIFSEHSKKNMVTTSQWHPDGEFCRVIIALHTPTTMYTTQEALEYENVIDPEFVIPASILLHTALIFTGKDANIIKKLPLWHSRPDGDHSRSLLVFDYMVSDS